MYQGKRIGVVVPAYNEEDSVGRVIETVPGFVDRVYAVDDASTDETWGEIQRVADRLNDSGAAVAAASAEDGSSSEGSSSTGDGTRPAAGLHVRPLQHGQNRGVGGAIKTGYLAALEDEVDVVAVMAGDGQMDPDLLERIVEPVAAGEADYAKGNRFTHPENRRNVPRFRFFGNLLITALAKVASGYWTIGDSMNGFTAISREALEAIEVEDLYESYGFCNDMLTKLNVADQVVVDVPAPIIYGDETSHIDYFRFVPLGSLNLLRNFRWRLTEKYVLRDVHPIVPLYGLGVAGVLLSLLQVLAAVRSRVNRENRLSRAGTTGLLGGLAFTLAMVEDRRENESLGGVWEGDGDERDW